MHKQLDLTSHTVEAILSAWPMKTGSCIIGDNFTKC